VLLTFWGAVQTATASMHHLTLQNQQCVLGCGTYQGHRTEARRILRHLKNNLGDTRNLVLFTGFRAENTIGQKIVAPETFADAIQNQYGLNVEIPARGNSYDLD
jgi:hypothetical protein